MFYGEDIITIRNHYKFDISDNLCRINIVFNK